MGLECIDSNENKRIFISSILVNILFVTFIYELLFDEKSDLTSDELLKKCLHGQTQNVNEAFNAFVWKRAPKDIYIGRNILEMAVASAVLAFNDGASGLLKVMEAAGLHLGHYNLLSSQIYDNKRIQNANLKSEESTKKRRKVLHNLKKGHLNEKDYGAGMH